jgi:hypothetical protein
MSRITVWLAATAVLMVFLIGYQTTIAGVGGKEQERPEVTTTVPAGDAGTSARPGAPGQDSSHPPK